MREKETNWLQRREDNETQVLGWWWWGGGLITAADNAGGQEGDLKGDTQRSININRKYETRFMMQRGEVNYRRDLTLRCRMTAHAFFCVPFRCVGTLCLRACVIDGLIPKVNIQKMNICN